MRISVHHRKVVVTAAGALLLVLGIALAMADKPAERPRPRAKPAKGAKSASLDCKVLEQQLSQCGPAIAAAFDSGLGARLAKQPPHLREAVLRTISAEFVSQVANPCYARRGKLKQADAIAACLASSATAAKAAPCKSAATSARCKTARQLARCRAFAKCLAVKVRALPRPKPAKGAKPAKDAKSAKGARPAPAKAVPLKPMSPADKARPAPRPAPSKK